MNVRKDNDSILFRREVRRIRPATGRKENHKDATKNEKPLNVEEVGHRHQNDDVDQGQPPSDFKIIPGPVAAGAHVEGVDLVGRQDEGVGDPEAYHDGGHARIDPYVVGDGDAQGDEQRAGPEAPGRSGRRHRRLEDGTVRGGGRRVAGIRNGAEREMNELRSMLAVRADVPAAETTGDFRCRSRARGFTLRKAEGSFPESAARQAPPRFGGAGMEERPFSTGIG